MGFVDAMTEHWSHVGSAALSVDAATGSHTALGCTAYTCRGWPENASTLPSPGGTTHSTDVAVRVQSVHCRRHAGRVGGGPGDAPEEISRNVKRVPKLTPTSLMVDVPLVRAVTIVEALPGEKSRDRTTPPVPTAKVDDGGLNDTYTASEPVGDGARRERERRRVSE